VIRRFRLLPLLVVVLLASCRSTAPSPQERERLAAQQRLLSLCTRNQERLPRLLQTFQTAQNQLAEIASATYTPSPGPKPLDPEEQRRLTIYDQQVEQDLYEQAVDAWRRQEAERRERWEREQASQKAAAAETLNRAATALRQVHPELLLAGAGAAPRLNEPEVERFRSCQPERFR
jgi:Skp family chaperone for outer membrane proteins